MHFFSSCSNCPKGFVILSLVHGFLPFIFPPTPAPLHLLCSSKTPEEGEAWVSLVLLRNIIAFYSIVGGRECAEVPAHEGDFGDVPGLLLHRRGWGARRETPSHASRLLAGQTRAGRCATSCHHQGAIVPSGFSFGGLRGECRGREARGYRQHRNSVGSRWVKQDREGLGP